MLKTCLFLALALVAAQELTELSLHGSGTTNPSKLYWKWMETLEEQAKRPIRATYRAVGSSTGMIEFLSKANDFAASEVPLSQEQRDSYGAAHLHLPHVVGAISIFHNVPAAEMGASGKVDLTGLVLAKIFQRDITTWDHPDIMALNPDLKVPAGQNIKVVHRVKGSSSTFLTTQYMNIVAPTVWKLGAGTTVNWPADTIAAEGSGGVSDTITSTLYSIGYIDAAHGHELGLKEIELENKNGMYLSSRDAVLGDSADAAVTPASDGLWADVNLVNIAGDKSWPMVAFSYLMVPKDLTAMGEKGYLLKAFLQYAMSKEGLAEIENFGFKTVPQSILDKNMIGINSLILDPAFAGSEFIWETSTTANVGQGINVFSVKRRQYADYLVNLHDDQVKSLQADVKGLQLAMGKSQLEMHGSGTTNPSKLYWKYAESLEEMLGRPLLVTYRAVGSSTGQAEFLAGAADFGAAELPMTAAQRTAYGKTMFHIPHVLGTISIFANVPGASGSLNLTATLLAKIFQRDIKTWDHPDIIKENPNLKVATGQDIKVMHRVKGSSSTYLTTQYLDTTSKDGVWKLGYGATVEWPADTKGCEGSSGMSKCISSTNFAIGYIDTDHGIKDGLLEIKLKNADGKFLTAVTADIGAAAQNGPAVPAASESFENFNLVNKPGPKTWPMTTFSYMFVPADMTHMGDKGPVLKAYLEFAMSKVGQDYCAEFGFARLPQNVLDINNAAIAAIKLHEDYPPFVWEWSTMPIEGAGSHVLSVKRRQYSDLKVDDYRTSIAFLMEQNTIMAAEIKTLKIAAGLIDKTTLGTCEDNCGGKGFPSGTCWCDETCMNQTPPDCCQDWKNFCSLDDASCSGPFGCRRL